MTGLVSGDVFASVYRVERLLGSGGMGVVYEVFHLPTGRRRALKVMSPRLLSNAIAYDRFVLEAQIGAQIPSEHVVTVLDAGIDVPSSAPWLAMELLEGEVLGDRVARLGALSGSEVDELVRQVTHALGAAHERGIVHRDLKPDNLFIAKSHRVGVPFHAKILDFGIAKLLEDGRRTGTSTEPIGTPLWLAPEQADERGRIGPPTDVWALGLVVFFALTGRSYWRSASESPIRMGPLLTEVMVEPLVPASVRARELAVTNPFTAELDTWIARCIARAPVERWRDARAALEGWPLGPRTSAPRVTPEVALSSPAADARSLPGTMPMSTVMPADRLAGPRTSLDLPTPGSIDTSAPEAAPASASSVALTPWLILPLLGGAALALGALAGRCTAPSPPPPPRPIERIVVVAADAGPAPPIPTFEWPSRERHRWAGVVTFPRGYTYAFVLVLTRGSVDRLSGNFTTTVLRTRERTSPVFLIAGDPQELHGTFSAGRVDLELDDEDHTPIRIEVDLQGEIVGRVGLAGRLIGWLSES